MERSIHEEHKNNLHNYSQLELTAEGSEKRRGGKERELPMMQVSSRMVPSESRSHTKIQEALHCTQPPLPIGHLPPPTPLHFSRSKCVRLGRHFAN
uniref:Uncharacterized protein n=1 Tax=Oryza brachyantha TaxID=4533 RepID=J3MI98_ORYBR